MSQIPRLYETEEIPPLEKMIYEHHFLPHTPWQWYISELDPEQKIAFGYIYSGLDPSFSEWGYIDLEELAEIEIKIPLIERPSGRVLGEIPQRIEKDLRWQPTMAGLIKKIKETSVI